LPAVPPAVDDGMIIERHASGKSSSPERDVLREFVVRLAGAGDEFCER